jgi:exonuclease III
MADHILFWNVRGVNAWAHRNAVHELLDVKRISLVCLQETKLDLILDFDVIQLCGFDFDYVFLLAVHTCSGILVAWRVSA